MVEIPQRLRVNGIKFVLVQRGTKKPFQEEWQKKNMQFNDSELLEHLTRGGSYGVMGGGEKQLVLVDFDNIQIQEEISKKLPETFTVKTGSGMLHKYYFSDDAKSFKIFDEEMRTLCDVQGEGKMVVGAGSIHPNGSSYQIVNDIDIAYIPYAELRAIILPYDKKPKQKKIIDEVTTTEYKNEDFIDVVKQRISVPDILSLMGVDTSRNPTNCPFHDSKGGKCLGFEKEVAHCFHCDGSWNVFSLVKQWKNYSFVEALEFIAEQFNLREQLEESREAYRAKQRQTAVYEKKEVKSRFLSMIGKKEKDWANASEILVDYIRKYYFIYTTKVDDKSEMWIYDGGIYKPNGKSELASILRNILEESYNSFIHNYVVKKIESDTYIESNEFFRIAPTLEVPVENGLLNIYTRELFPFTHEKIFFNKLPVKYDPSSRCEKIDKFLSDVLADSEDKKVFYELCGFGLLKEYRFEKSFMFLGDGRNGKGKSMELIKRMIGINNTIALPLSHLIPESFEISYLHGKHFNLAGDIGNRDLRDTSMFKSLTGRDLIIGKRKFLPPISFENFAKFVFACNELPMVYDTSRGFWDRWILLYFPYTFVTKEEYESTKDKTYLKIKDEDIVNKISTPEELSGLLNQALDGLQRLMLHNRFSSTKGCDEVKDMWIRGANSFAAFCIDNLDEQYDSRINKKEIRKRYAAYCKKHKLKSKNDFIIKKVLQEEYGVGEEDSRIGDTYERFWTGIKWKSSLG